jgi:molybdate transport system substrate-binding protein
VKAVVAKVQLGEADAGIVYTTDARAAAARTDSFALPAAHDIVATYPIVALRGGANSAAAAAFVAFVLSPAGQRTLQEFGFLAR